MLSLGGALRPVGQQRPTTVGQLSADSRPTVAQLSANSLCYV